MRNGFGRSPSSSPHLVALKSQLICWNTWWRRLHLYGAKQLAGNCRRSGRCWEVVPHPGEAAPRPTRVKLFSTFEKGQYGRKHQKPSAKKGT
jgi:hypothetical protein